MITSHQLLLLPQLVHAVYKNGRELIFVFNGDAVIPAVELNSLMHYEENWSS